MLDKLPLWLFSQLDFSLPDFCLLRFLLAALIVGLVVDCHQSNTSFSVEVAYARYTLIMGCASSTEIITDPVTGEKKQKHKMGGAYPGNRRTPQQVYTPGPSEFNANGQATAHFVNYGGGNALVLKQDGIAQLQSGPPLGKQPTYIQVTLPAGVNGGDKIHVQAPDGRLNEIIVPPGFGPGSTFTVEFADGPPPTPAPASYAPPLATATPERHVYNNNNNYYNNNNDNNGDDGFASGFNNPAFVPTVTPMTSYNQDPEINLASNNYPPPYVPYVAKPM